MQNHNPEQHADDDKPSASRPAHPDQSSQAQNPQYDQMSFTILPYTGVEASAAASPSDNTTPGKKRASPATDENNEKTRHPPAISFRDDHRTLPGPSRIEWTEAEKARIFDLKTTDQSSSTTTKMVNAEGNRNDTTEHYVEKIFNSNAETIAEERDIAGFDKYEFLSWKFQIKKPVIVSAEMGVLSGEEGAEHRDAHIREACSLAKGYANWEKAAQRYKASTGKHISPEYIRQRWMEIQREE